MSDFWVEPDEQWEVNDDSDAGILVRSTSPGYGELAVVPPQSELQLTTQRQDSRFSSRRSSFGHISLRTHCPTCHRPLVEGEVVKEVPQPAAERKFTPQYFRALGPSAVLPPLSICDSPALRPSSQRRLAENRTLGSSSPVPSDATGVSPTIPNTNKNVSAMPESSTTRGDDDNDDVGGYYKRYFREIQKLGNGTFGGVYLAQHVMEGVGLGYFALKKIPVGNNMSYLHNVLSEVRILEEVKQHPNVVEYKHSWVDVAQTADFGPPVRCLFILMEYATMGSLESYLERHGTALPTIAVWYFFLSAVAGTAHLHRKNIIHRDLKPQNLLLTGRPEELPRVLVSDFGTSTLLSEMTYERTGGTGTVEYMAPELLECSGGTEGSYIYSHTKATDVWSLGMILHYLACDGTLPLRLANGGVILDVPNRSHYIRPPEMIELMRVMLHHDPTKRPTCDDILESTVVRTIQRSFKKANMFSDILPKATPRAKHRRASSVMSQPLLTPREGESEVRTRRVNWITNSDLKLPPATVSPTPHWKPGCVDVDPQPHSPLVEVPLMLQYKTLESKREPPSGVQRAQKTTMVERGVQTDYVKIVYE